MSALQQKREQSQTQQKQGGSLLKTGTWKKVFPMQHNTETKSCTFVKKLMAVAISNITYLRSIFPEKVYSNRSLDGLPLKILKEDSGCEEATGLVNWLRGAFEAIEKRYLRELIFIIYMNPEDTNDVHEMYTFRFGYSDGDRTECQLLQGPDQKRVNSVTDDDLYNATQSMLRTIIVLVQGLGPLPNSAYMTMQLTYYDEVTPADYEPPGFCHTEWTSPRLPSGAISLNSGDVSTNFHTVKLRVKAAPSKILVKESQETGDKTVAITNSFSVSESEFEGKESTMDQRNSGLMIEKGASSLQKDVKMQTNNKNTETAQTSISLFSDKLEKVQNSSEINCNCQSNRQDNLMLECTICHTFQHGACYRIIFQSDIPVEHVCASCSMEDEKLICTDPKLAKHCKKFPPTAISATCLFRRTLAYLLSVKTITISDLQNALGIDTEYAEGILEKLKKEKIVDDSVSEEYNVANNVLRLSSLPKFLGIKRFKQMNCAEQGDGVFNQCSEIEKTDNTDTRKEISLDIQKEHSDVVKAAKDIENQVNKNGDNKEITTKGDEIDFVPSRSTRGRKRELRANVEQLKDIESKTSRRSKRSKLKASIVEGSDQLI